MIVYSTAFALPFVLLALVPRSVSRLPRAGAWMETLRVLIGLLEVAAAIKFVSNADMVLGWGVFTRSVVLVAWSALAVAAAVYLGRNARDRVERRKWSVTELVPIGAALLVAAWLASGVNGRLLHQMEAFLPPATRATAIGPASGESATWMLNDYPAALSAAKSTGRLMFVDFTGYTCTNCRWMEANIFSRPDVSAELGQFVLARLYTDGDGELYERQQAFQEKTFGTVALPLYAVMTPDGKVRSTFSGLTRNPAEFIAFLRRAQLNASPAKLLTRAREQNVASR
jgi:thiol:disulfide interchange protein DsbD